MTRCGSDTSWMNDTDPRNWPDYRDYFVQDYVNLIGEFRRVNPDVEIYVCRMTPIFVLIRDSSRVLGTGFGLNRTLYPLWPKPPEQND